MVHIEEEGFLTRTREASEPDLFDRQLTTKSKKHLVLKHLKTTSWFITARKDLIWTRTTRRTTLKKMPSEGSPGPHVNTGEYLNT
jgi:hypothetical protein